MYYSMTFLPWTKDISNSMFIPPLDLDEARNTWVHWRLVPETRPSIKPPSFKSKYVDIEGYDGRLDLSQALTGYPTYSNREGEIKFAVINDFRNWQQAYSDIMATLHGKKMIMIYEEDPAYYYVGRWFVKEWKTDKTRSSLTVTYDLEPYKWRLWDFAGNWLWNPFNFEADVIASRSAFFNSELIVDSDTEQYMFWLQPLQGKSTTDSIGEGHLNMRENFISAVGNAPVPLWYRVRSDENSSITLRFYNYELFHNDIGITKTFNDGYNHEVTDPDFLITNYSGINKGLRLCVTGHGKIQINFRPGRI